MNEEKKVVNEVEVVKDGEKPKNLEAFLAHNPRAYVTKTGSYRSDRLRPMTFHDNRSGGTYAYGKNASKKAKRAAKNI